MGEQGDIRIVPIEDLILMLSRCDIFSTPEQIDTALLVAAKPRAKVAGMPLRYASAFQKQVEIMTLLCRCLMKKVIFGIQHVH